MHPGQRNSLDALAKRYNVDNSKRDLHGALLDAQILTEIYLSMTGGQVSLSLDARDQVAASAGPAVELRLDRSGLELPVLLATAEETTAHEALLAKIAKKCGRVIAWPATALPAAGDAASSARTQIQRSEGSLLLEERTTTLAADDALLHDAPAAA
jgi:DNA polymerase-3 subunit epsilon